MKLSAIVAVGENGEIGRGGQMPWPHLPRDMRWFQLRTHRKPVIMGRKTWFSLPSSPLPGRPNLVLSRSWPGPEGPIPLQGCLVYKTVDSVIEAAESYGVDEAVVIGGSEVYRAFLPRLETIYLTKISATYPDADAFFPYPLPANEWAGSPVFDRWFVDGKSGLTMGFYRFDRIVRSFGS